MKLLRHAIRPESLAMVFVLSLWLLQPEVAQADAITDWNVHANSAANATCIGPSGNGLYESRLYAMMHVAIHDAVNAIDRRSRPYVYDDRVDPAASIDAAVATAARDVLVAVIGQLAADCAGTGVAVTEAVYTAAMAAVPAGAARDAGVAAGHAAADAILARRADDGSDVPLIDENFPQGDEPGDTALRRKFPSCSCRNGAT